MGIWKIYENLYGKIVKEIKYWKINRVAHILFEWINYKEKTTNWYEIDFVERFIKKIIIPSCKNN